MATDEAKAKHAKSWAKTVFSAQNRSKRNMQRTQKKGTFRRGKARR